MANVDLWLLSWVIASDHRLSIEIFFFFFLAKLDFSIDLVRCCVDMCGGYVQAWEEAQGWFQSFTMFIFYSQIGKLILLRLKRSGVFEVVTRTSSTRTSSLMKQMLWLERSHDCLENTNKHHHAFAFPNNGNANAPDLNYIY